MDKSKLIILLKVLAAVIAGILSVLTVACVSSCSTARHYTESKGRTTILLTDTTVINHSGELNIKLK